MTITKAKTVAFDARYVSDRFHGIGRHAYHLLDALTRFDLDRHYLVFYNPDYLNTRFNMEMLQERPNVELRPIRLPLYLPSEQFIWPLLLMQARADIFHSPYVVLPLLAPVRLVMTVHDLIFECYPEYRPRSYLQNFYRPIVQLGTRRADIVLTGTEAARRDIQSYYRIESEKVHVISDGVDSTFRRESDPALTAVVRERYNLPEHFILTLGAGRPHKNVETLVEAFARLDPTLTPALVIGGELDSRFPDHVGARIRAHGIENRVIRTGMIQEADLPTVYSLADIFVFPSITEGFGLPPLEAMACGTPVLASTSPAVSEVVSDAALTFDARNSQQLATLLKRALTDSALRSAFRRRGLERVRAFTWEHVAQQTLLAYASIETTTGKMLNASS